MRWLLRSRRAIPLALAAVLVALLTTVATHVMAPFPDLTQGRLLGLAVSASLATPAIGAVLVAGVAISSHPERELTGARNVARIDRTLVVAITASTLLVYAASWATTGDMLLLTAARNQVGLTGLALLLRRVTSASVATVIPLVYVVVAFCFGNRDQPEPWAWPLSIDGQLPLAIGVGLLLLGLTLGLGQAAQRTHIRATDATEP